MQKKSKKPGKNTLVFEIQNISRHGMWLLIGNKEFFVSFERYPWFLSASINDVYAVELSHGKHLHWSELDIDIELAALENPEAYPLVYKK